MSMPNQSLQDHPPRPSTANSETSHASSDQSFLQQQPFPSLTDQSHSLYTVPESPVSRNTRGLVIDSSAVISPPPRSIRRKPVSSTASPITARYSSGEYLALTSGLSRPDQRFSRSCSVDSPTVYEFPRPPVSRSGLESPDDFVLIQGGKEKTSATATRHPLASADSIPAVIAGEVKRPSSRADNPDAPQTHHTTDLSQHQEQSTYDDLFSDEEEEDPLSEHIFDGYNSDSSDNSNSNHSHTMSLHVTRKTTPPQLNLKPADSLSDNYEVKSPNTDKPLPKSPNSSKLGNFFGWNSPSNTEASDKGFSPLPSPFHFSKTTSVTDASPVTTVGPQSLLDAPKAAFGSPSSREYCESYLATPETATYSPHHQIEEMEDELKAISAELAASIRREMDLEDLVDRLQAERDNPTATANKRTSDYFSDSGYSSAKLSEYDQSREEIEKIQRRSEQEKAQIRLELTNKLQDERSRRSELDEQIKELSERASQIDLEKVNNVDASGRIKELESTCETLRRKLTEERQVKDNFEDLLTALKDELQNASNERDDLRDEIVPSLQARVEGLEAQAVELEKMNYESSKLQQELQTLKVENTSLKQMQANSMGTISEESGFAGSRLSRSNSLTGPPSSFKLQRPPSGIMRSKTVKVPTPTESRDQLSERLKDVEEQRDALHRALKNLLERQEHQNRENEKKIRVLEMERDRLLTQSPQKAGFQREISNLRAEINVLRRRAEEALEQKWQVEKGLGGLKMDLDRAEQEIAELRSLLNEKDILIPPSLARLSSGSDRLAVPVTSEALKVAYQDLQKAYADSLERIKNLEASSSQDELTKLAMEKLEQTLSSTISERDLLRQESTSYKEQLDALKAEERVYLESEKALADELSESARRVEELAVQVRQQLNINQTLRQRISDTVARGEAAQKSNKDRITSMQAHLRSLEEKLEAAQNASEDRIVRHEEEISTLRASHNDQLKRMRDGLRSPRTFPPKSPLSPLFSTAAGAPRSPRLDVTRSGPAMNASEESQIDNLRARVAELENALSDADAEMQQVVGRMNTAQIEVLQLQEEREAAVNQTRKLERELQAEKVKAFEERFKSLQA